MDEYILVVDDELNIQRSMEMILSGAGYSVACAPSGEAALKMMGENAPQAVFLDINLPGIDGLDVLKKIRETNTALPVVMISGHATIERAVEATRLGAFDFIEKPFSRERILVLVRNATESNRLKREVARLTGDAAQGEIIGRSPGIRELQATIEQVAPTDTRVLILGESGTGKELVASALHAGSQRAKQPFVRVNCAAIPEELIESELFGAVKGAYTGAMAARKGRFAAANGGTIFLDEIGDMSHRAQAKVLRVLQEGEYEAVGSTKTESVDVRVLAATHHDLHRLVEEGRFREDLLFRLNVIPIHVPPLRERTGDVALLLEHFLGTYATHHEKPAPVLLPEAIMTLEAYAWPGNIRELKNLAERLLILSRGREISRADLPMELRDTAGGSTTQPGIGGDPSPYANLPLREARDAFERDMIRAALERNEGNVTRTAAQLGLERTHLHKRMKAQGLK
jgi:two-component system, NtrC family, nitrogen regulation response regulator NtrX